MPNYMTETCATCAHRDPEDRCRARPPTPMLMPVPQSVIAPGGPRVGIAMASATLRVADGHPACGLWEDASDVTQAAPPPAG